MLNGKNSIRTEWRVNGKKGRFRVYYFICHKCPNEIKCRKSYFKKHTGLCNSCSSKITIQKAILKNKKRPFEARYNNFIARVKDEPLKTDISYEDYLAFTKTRYCHYCSSIIPWEAYSENMSGFFLDRKDNNKYHMKDNVVVCCGVCNFTKRNYFTYEEFVLLGPTLYIIQKNRNKRLDCPKGVCEF